MVELIVGIACGACVCAFGMWAFLHGIRCGKSISEGHAPENISGPVTAVKEAVEDVIDEKAASRETADKNLNLQQQLMSMTNDDYDDHIGE